MRDFEVVAVLSKTFSDRVLTDPEIDKLVKEAKAGKKAVTWSTSKGTFRAEVWYRVVTAEHVPSVLRAVRKTIGPDPEIIHLELVREPQLADAHG